MAKVNRQPNQALVPVAFHAIATLPVQYPAATHSTHTMKCNATPPRVYSSPYSHFRRGGRSAATNAGSTTGLYAGRPARCRAVLWLSARCPVRPPPGAHRAHRDGRAVSAVVGIRAPEQHAKRQRRHHSRETAATQYGEKRVFHESMVFWATSHPA